MKPVGHFLGVRGTVRIRAGGFSLIEVTIALAVAAFCLLAILGLLQTGITSQRATVEQTAATGIATQIDADLATGATGTTARFHINLTNQAGTMQTLYFDEAGRPTGDMGAPAGADARYRASVTVRPPAAGTVAATGVHLLVTWPAAADPDPGQNPVRFSGSVEAWTALNRN